MQMWDERYADENFVYGKEPNDFLVQSIKNIPKQGNVLCLAEGEGRNATYLASLGFHVFAVDQSKVGLEKARKLAVEKKVSIHTEVSNLDNFDLGTEKWDIIVSIWVHVPQPLRKDLHKRVIKALKPGGYFILEAYTAANIGRGTGGPPDPELTMSFDALKEELASLDPLLFQETEREISEGDAHQGISAVVQAFMKK